MARKPRPRRPSPAVSGERAKTRRPPPAPAPRRDRSPGVRGERTKTQNNPPVPPRVPDESVVKHPPPAQPRPDPEVVRKQRLLRAAGFPVVVDGIWGPASQAAWNRYTHRAPAQTAVGGERAHSRRDDSGRRRQARLAVEQARQRAAEAAERARLVAATAKRTAQLTVAASSRPRGAAGAPDSTIRGQIAAQRAQSEKQMTAEAIARERTAAHRFAAAARRKTPEQMTTKELVAITVDPLTGSFNPQKPADVKLVQRFLKSHGHAALAVDGVWGRTTFAALVTELHRHQRAEAEAQRAAVVNRLYKPGLIKPGDSGFPLLGTAPKPGALLKLLQRGGFTASIIFRDLARKAFGPEAGMLWWKEQELAKIERTLFGPFAPPAFLRGEIDQRALRLAILPETSAEGSRQYLALAAARTAEDFQRRLRKIGRDEEAEFRRRQAERAHKDTSWWEKTLDVISYPGEVFRTQLVAQGVAIKNVGDAFLAALATGPLGDPKKAARGELTDPEVTAKKLLATFQREHPWLNLAFESLVDPINLTGGVPAELARGGALLALRAERLGYAIAANGDLVRLPVALVAHPTPFASLTGHALAGALIAPAALGRDVARAGRAVRASKAVTLATRQKTVAVAVARAKLRQAFNHGFRAHPDVPEFKNLNDIANELKMALDHTDLPLRGATNKLTPTLVRTLHDEGISLWADIGRSELSEFGGMLKARLLEGARVNEVQRLALARANARFGEVWEANLDGSLRARRQLADDAARAEYREVVRSAGNYYLGSATPEIARLINPRIEQARQRIDSLFVSLQDEIVEQAEALGFALFDDTGRFIGRQATTTRLLRALADDAFDTTVRIRNANFGRFFTRGEAEELISDEIERAESRLRGYASRRRAGGRAIQESWVDEQVNAASKRVRAAWAHVPGKGWTDTRETLDVPSIYLRHIEDAYGAAVRGTHPLLSSDDVPPEIRELLNVTVPPARAAGTHLDDEIEKLSWYLTGRHEVNQYAETYSSALRSLKNDGNAHVDGLAFQDALEARTAALAAASDTALPRQLQREFALWQAFAHSQSAPVRAAYIGLSAWMDVWVTLTLPLRPGFFVRNVIDNTAKMLIEGARNPMAYFLGGENPGSKMRSLFDADLRAIRWMLTIGDRYQANPAVRYFDELVETFWDHSSDVLGRIFAAHGVYVPEAVIDTWKTSAGVLEEHSIFGRSRNWIWELMAARPENYAKRVLYRDTFYKATERGLSEEEAARLALEAVERTLFDYSKISTLEDNLRLLFPFIQFWRKTTAFAVRQSFDKPWLPAQFFLMEERLQEINADLPEWMRRYIRTDRLTDLLSEIPGMKWLLPTMGSHEAMTDPVSFLSFNPLYRAFKSENQSLPPDKAGWRFIAPIIDALNATNLTMNPFVRKPLEIAGVANFRAWQNVFPQTSMIEAFTRRYFEERFPNGLNVEAWLEDKTLAAIGSDFSVVDKIAANFNQYVQVEMAGQAARGEPVSRERAERKLQDFFLVQNALAYFVGIYTRRMTPADLHLYRIAEALHKGELDYLGLTPQEQRAYQLFKRRKLSELEFDRYLEIVPLLQAYYSLGSYDKAEEFKRRHPEIVPHVEPAWKGKPFSDNYVRNVGLVIDTQAAFRLFKLVDDLDVADDVRDLATRALVTPKLREFWARNDTPGQVRDRMLRGLYFQYVQRLNETFHAIPEKDYEAKQGFLDANPILGHWWTRNNEHSDDLMSVINDSNATLRERYFEYVDRDDWDGARAFLHRFPFIFEFTKAADRVSPDGDWIGGGGRRGRTQHAADYLRAKSALDFYFGLPADQRAAWLAGGSSQARMVKWYFDRYSHFKGGGRPRTQHARDYLAAKKWLEVFFGMPEDKRDEWLDGDSEGAKIVNAYFRKYASPGGNTQHGRDYAAAREHLEHYFALSKSDKRAARAWLHGGSEGARAVLAYFKKYGKMNKLARKWGDLIESENPDLLRRLRFWQRYWRLPPDKRPAFILREGERAGIFVYGPLGDKERHDREQDYLRKAIARGLGEKTALFLRVKPLLDLFFTLNDSQQQLFLRANPELREYLDRFGNGSPTGDKKLDALVESYFQLPEDSTERTAFLRKHSAVQRFFDSRSTPAERALHRLLEAYFVVPPGDRRKTFLAKHPEIQAYFDKKRRERELERAALEPFDRADPRLRSFFERAEANIVAPGERMAEFLREQRAKPVLALEARRDRRT